MKKPLNLHLVMNESYSLFCLNLYESRICGHERIGGYIRYAGHIGYTVAAVVEEQECLCGSVNELYLAVGGGGA